MHPAPNTTLVVMLGASEFKKEPHLNNEAFARSASEFLEYLLSQNGFKLPARNLLDLFNSPMSPSEQDEAIVTFIRARTSELVDAQTPARDILIFYVGHGDFFSPNDQYYVALQNTRHDAASISGYPIHTLATTLKINAANLRRFVILDCCFSAAAYETFQSSGPLVVARRKTEEKLPTKGTALLCAAGPRDPAKALDGMQFTMFSDVLLEVLKNGGTDLPETMSFVDVGKRAESLIRERFDDQGVRPQVLDPDQTAGLLGELPFFPNLGMGAQTLQATMSQIEKRLAAIAVNQQNVNDRLKQLEDKAPVAMQGVGPNFERGYRGTGLTREQWDTLPASIKHHVLQYQQRAAFSRNWVALSSCICLACVASVTAHELYGYNRLEYLGIALIAVCGFFGIGQFVSELLSDWLNRGIPHLRRLPASYEQDGPWSSYDIVVMALRQPSRRVFGFECSTNSANFTRVIYSLTFATMLFMVLWPTVARALPPSDNYDAAPPAPAPVADPST